MIWVGSPLAVENLGAEHGRGIHLMKLAMDEISFERDGTEIHMRKAASKQKTPAWRPHDRASRPSPGVRVVELHRRPCAETSQTCLMNGDLDKGRSYPT
jgi:hypothetical protein